MTEPLAHPRYPHPNMDPRRPATGKTVTSFAYLAHMEKVRSERRERLSQELNAVATKALTSSPEPLR